MRRLPLSSVPAGNVSFTTAREMMLKNQKELEQGWRRHALDEEEEEEEEVPRCSGGLYHVGSNGRLVEREDAEEEVDLRAAILGAPRAAEPVRFVSAKKWAQKREAKQVQDMPKITAFCGVEKEKVAKLASPAIPAAKPVVKAVVKPVTSVVKSVNPVVKPVINPVIKPVTSVIKPVNPVVKPVTSVVKPVVKPATPETASDDKPTKKPKPAEEEWCTGEPLPATEDEGR